MTSQHRNTVFMLTLHQVIQRTGLSRSTIYYKLDPDSPYYDPTFPTQIRLGNGSAVRWIEAEINAWLEQCVLTSRGGCLCVVTPDRKQQGFTVHASGRGNE